MAFVLEPGERKSGGTCHWQFGHTPGGQTLVPSGAKSINHPATLAPFTAKARAIVGHCSGGKFGATFGPSKMDTHPCTPQTTRTRTSNS